MSNEWVKLPRKLLESRLYTIPIALQVYVYALFQAQRKETVVNVKGCVVTLKSGQCIFGRNEWARELGTTPTPVYNALRKLEKNGLVEIEATTKYSVLTITDWDLDV